MLAAREQAIRARERQRANCSTWRRLRDSPFDLITHLASLKEIATATEKAEQALEAIDALDQWNRWLNHAVLFDHGLILMEKRPAIALFERLFDRKLNKRAEKIEDFCLLAANLLKTRKRRPLAFPLDRNAWGQGRYQGRPKYFILEAIKMLENCGLVGIKKGHNLPPHPRRARVWPTKKFVEFLSPVGEILREPVELVELRDQSHEPVEYEDTRETHRIRAILRRANIVNRKHEVQLVEGGQVTSLRTDLHAVFNGDFEHGGRLYTSGGGYQGVEGRKPRRLCIRIDGEPVVELDFSALHPRMLYALEGIQYDADPYAAVSDDPELRPIFKIAVLIILNAERRATAIWEGKQATWNDTDRRDLLRRKRLTDEKIVEMFEKAHAPIAHNFFCKKTGLRLMNHDSKIALRVVEHFTSKGIPVLAVHDSFLVQKRYKDELSGVMVAAYSKITGGFSCPIDS